MMLAMLGMAVGTGNIWRFPRIAATNGGGTFLIAWIVFLFAWSMPLLILEMAMGKGTRFGPVGAFVKTIGPRFGWMGAWVAWCATAIMFYYSVVMGWTVRYFVGTVTGEVTRAVPAEFWESFAASPASVVTHVISVALGVFVVARGVRGIETAARFLMPTLLALVIILAIRAVTLPGAGAGLAFLFTPNLSELANYRIWLEALTQNAWDTGAGWGLALTYAVYMRANEDTALNGFVLPIGNNCVSLMAGIMVLCTVFSIMPDATQQIVGAGNEGLTFIWVPQLFARIPAGRFLMALFFLALVFAAWTSLISMIELATRVLEDSGVARARALVIVGAAGLLCGLPSALSMTFFQNQDFVWGVGLMLSGLLFAVGVLRYGVTEWRERFINTEYSDIRVGRWWDWAIRLVVAEASVLIVWWLWQVRGDGLAAMLSPFRTFNIGTVLVQWAVVLAVLLALNRWMVGRLRKEVTPGTVPAGHMPPSIP
ncbi:MAG: sodium-dependent transporter [Gemmatimonadetes bacterium]|nr:sodium-dependent transporter [Gemmatimonadota bacterium]